MGVEREQARERERGREQEIEPTDEFEAGPAWRAGLVAGVVAAVAMGAVISVMRPATLQEGIAGLYGMAGNLAVGWIAHLVHGALFGVVFAAILSDPILSHVAERRWKSVVAGGVYGLVLAVVGAGVIMPMWLATVGFASPPTVPNVTAATLTWHLVYGVVLGGLFPYVADV